MPRSRVPDMLVAIEAIGVRNRIGVGTFGHAGDGNLHPTFVLDRDEGDARGRAGSRRRAPTCTRPRSRSAAP